MLPARPKKNYPVRPALATLAGLLTLLAPSGCRRAHVPHTTEELTAAFAAVRDEPAQHLQIKWQGSPYAEGGQPGSWKQRRLEARFNVALDVNFIPTFSYDRLLRFKLIGGDIPDVFWMRDAREAGNAAQQGFALEVPYETLVRHAPDYVRTLLRHAPDAWLLSQWRGKNFGVPTFTNANAVFPFPGIWNRTWLDRVGVKKIPETLAEMEDALRRFRENDPDGNGQRDTFGYCPWKPGSSAGSLDRSFEEIFGAFGIQQNAWLVRDGRVAWGGTLPAAREALALLRRWYSGGLIHPDYMTLPLGNLEVRTQLVTGRVGYIMGFNLSGDGAFDERLPNSIATLIASVRPGTKIAPGWLPTGPRGERGVHTWGGSVGGVVMFGPQLARSPEKLVRVLTIFDAVCRDDELMLELQVGKRGLHWEWDPDYGIRKIPPYDAKPHSPRELLGEGILTSVATSFGYFIPFSAPQELCDRFTTARGRAYRDKHLRPEWGIQDALLMSETVPSAGKYLSDLVQMQAVAFTEIIIGKRPIEAFEAFVAQWRRQGGDLLTHEANELYARKKIIREHVTVLLAAAPRP